MPSEDKIVKLSQARTLYNDLRDRIEKAVTNQIATVEETMEIINEYNSREEDEDMVFNANFMTNVNLIPKQGEEAIETPGFVTEDDADDIVTAYTSGKHVVINFVMHNELLEQLSGYYPPNNGGYVTITSYTNPVDSEMTDSNNSNGGKSSTNGNSNTKVQTNPDPGDSEGELIVNISSGMLSIDANSGVCLGLLNNNFGIINADGKFAFPVYID